MPNLPADTRASLILRLRNADDVVAWDEFVETYSPVVFRVARARGLQQADADNLVQEVMLKICQSIETWLERDDRGKFRAWLISIARNESVDLLTQRATRTIAKGGGATDHAITDREQADQLTALIDREYERAVFEWAAKQVRASVAEHTWQAFWLTHIQGLSVQQAADQLGVRPGNIYFGRSRVMSRLRELVSRYEE